MKKEQKEKRGGKTYPLFQLRDGRVKKKKERKEEKNRNIKTHSKATKTPAVIQQRAKQPQKKTTNNYSSSASSRTLFCPLPKTNSQN